MRALPDSLTEGTRCDVSMPPDQIISRVEEAAADLGLDFMVGFSF
jgi:hypothetical protein